MYQNVVVTKDRNVLDLIEEKLNIMDLDFLVEKNVYEGKLQVVQFSVFSSESRKVGKIDPELTKMFRSFVSNGVEVSYVLEKTSELYTFEGCERAYKQYLLDDGICWTTTAI